jgi:hypothetical protein
MSFNVIDNPDFKSKAQKAGFSNAQFKMLDGIYLQAASLKKLTQRSVDCDFDEGLFEFSYHISQQHPPLYKFIIRRVGPRTNMYELWQHNKGKILQSGLFDRVYNRLKEEIENL